ncbi:hypothetical protein K432DRAFT_387437 [Lepidopterella palustris CBS 459.81]|uniref:Ubiquitin-like protease family profile domain-containing protein n=1 Tax=Lepidopterella palustris CBS 459.81 TaxID=1314670 RepID=A0A8E2DX12_9PEZI|nr:hypothetical protein K432DRAFT_387437 [Lepidopterella palustris CBS 459.81]
MTLQSASLKEQRGLTLKDLVAHFKMHQGGPFTGEAHSPGAVSEKHDNTEGVNKNANDGCEAPSPSPSLVRDPITRSRKIVLVPYSYDSESEEEFRPVDCKAGDYETDNRETDDHEKKNSTNEVDASVSEQENAFAPMSHINGFSEADDSDTVMDIELTPTRSPVSSALPSDSLTNPEPNGSTYLELESAMITNREFLNIRKLDIDGWFEDGTLNVALSLLAQDYQAIIDHYDIFIAMSYLGQILWMIDKNEYTGEDLKAYSAEKKNLEGKRWVFIPINDGFDGNSSGTHWTLIVIDTQQGAAHYIDSITTWETSNRAIAARVVKGFEALMDIEICGLERRVEENVPDQTMDNFCGTDWGPCGPFVYSITQYILAGMGSCALRGSAQCFHIAFRGVDKQNFAFDSAAVRQEIWNKVRNAKWQQILEMELKEESQCTNAKEEHFQEAMEEGAAFQANKSQENEPQEDNPGKKPRDDVPGDEKPQETKCKKSKSHDGKTDYEPGEGILCQEDRPQEDSPDDNGSAKGTPRENHTQENISGESIPLGDMTEVNNLQKVKLQEGASQEGTSPEDKSQFSLKERPKNKKHTGNSDRIDTEWHSRKSQKNSIRQIILRRRSQQTLQQHTFAQLIEKRLDAQGEIMTPTFKKPKPRKTYSKKPSIRKASSWD